NTLKPHIDSNYRTKTEAKDTYIIGSSLGGLMAFYALLKYPEIFNHAGVFSPAFWVNPEIFDLASSTEISQDLFIYFLAGSNESETMIPNIQRMTEILNLKGLDDEHYEIHTVEGGEHNEALWRDGFPFAFHWFFTEH
ncbi:MAG: alpha/beta hydrolase, partial [Psychroserpens sp.]|nr:alpha/beta hydrolase [Psychroserpens sp.]